MKNFFVPTLTLLSIFLLHFCITLQAQNNLREEIQVLTNSINGHMGVGIKLLEGGDTLYVHGDDHFPMQSVYKFHLALAVLSQVDKGELTLDQKIMMRREDMIPYTHSPLAERYPKGDVALTLQEILSETVSKSDNNGCDLLFALVGGPKKVDAFIKGFNIGDVAIVNTEREMHADWQAQYKNWTTPVAMVELLDKFYHNKMLLPPSHTFLMGLLEKTITGPKRIRGLLPPETVVAHKTGMGGKDDIISAVNDVGIITLPNGRHLAIAFFISNPTDSIEILEDVMAQISKKVFDYYGLTK